MNMSRNLVLTLALLWLSACGDPQEAAQATIEEVSTGLESARSNLDPDDRLDTYNQLLEEVKSVGEDYAETPTGSAIAAGQSVDGVSISEIQARRDALAARAECYGSPTVECLRPFGSSATDGGRAQPQDAFAAAAELVCDRGFAAADEAIANFKINKPVYANELIQLALAAGQCDKPDEVKAAINAYMAAAPTANGERPGALMSILATPSLEAAWPMVFSELESGLQSGAIAGNAAANVTLTLALDYARMGNIEAALAKYTTFTDTLHYQADVTSKDNLAVAVMLAGDAGTAMKIFSGDGSTMQAIFHTHAAAQALGQRMGVTDTSGTLIGVLNNLRGTTDHIPTIADYFKPVAGQAKARDQKATDTIEGQLDKLAATATVQDGSFAFGNGIDTAYGILALVRQKLGEPDQAAAALEKARGLYVRLLGSVDAAARLDGHQQFVTLAVMIRLAQNDAAEAARMARKINLNGQDFNQLILASAAAASGDAAKALSVRGELGDMIQDYHAFLAMIDGLSLAGKPDQVEKLITAYPGDARQKADFYWPVVDRMIAEGDAEGARDYATKHALIKDERGKLSFDGRLLTSKNIAGNRDKAEPIIREMFKIGQEIDQGSGVGFVGGSDHYIAQNAAAKAFKNGYTDLGIELYQAAVNRDQRPLLAAFPDNIDKDDMTRVLMLAQDNVSGDALTYVIDHAIQHLARKEQ